MRTGVFHETHRSQEQLWDSPTARHWMASFLLALLALLAAPALAQERPATVPLRDVDVTYRAGVGAATVQQRSRWWVGEGKLRLDPPTPGVYMVVDTRARTMAMVSDADRGVVDLPAPATAMDGQFTRRGTDTVAGLACTEWETLDTQGLPTLACFTADGVLLRARRGAAVFVEAVQVSYGPPDPAAFVVPPSYKHSGARR